MRYLTMLKVALAVIGTILILIGLAQGLSLSNVFGDYDAAIRGYVGGSIPAVFGAMGGTCIMYALSMDRYTYTSEDEIGDGT